MHPKTLLAYFGIEPKKSLGQNFLFDPAILDGIVAAAAIGPDDDVLEIGPGLGALTARLALAARRVVAVELDDRLLTPLHNQLDPFENVEIVHGDILKQEPAKLFDRPYRVVANVPYYITGAILRHLLDAPLKPLQIVLTVQKEVAQRICAEPPNMSLLAVSVQFYGAPRIVRQIGAGAFWPRPRVGSAVLTISLHPVQAAVDDSAFFAVVRAGFGHKRKQLKNNLTTLGLSKVDVAALLTAANIDGRRRAETLTVAEWIIVAQEYVKKLSIPG